MLNKKWVIEATDIRYKPIELYYQDGTLYWSRGYYWIDQKGRPIKKSVDGVLFDIMDSAKGEMSWGDIPKKVQDALVIIDQFTKDQIRQQEGLDGS